MNLRFPETEIHQWSERYNSGSTEAYFAQIRSKVQEQGYLDKELLKRNRALEIAEACRSY